MSDPAPGDVLGRRILCDGQYATVRYVGSVPPTAGLWLGVEWDNPQRGKHDGTHEGVQYFKCSHPLGGSFIRPKKANFGVDFVAALKSRYELKDNAGEESLKEAALHIGTKKVELVGFDVKGESQLGALKSISLYECNVSQAGAEGDIATTCPNITALNLSHNLLASWVRVSEIAVQLQSLEFLDLSMNRLSVPSDPASLSGAFTHLKVLSLSHTGVTWTEVLLCAPMWPALEGLHLASNEITVLQRPAGVFQSLKTLDLSNNQLLDGSQLAHLADLEALQTLTLINTGISTLRFPDVGRGYKTSMFSSLKSLLVDSNRISQWSFVSELDKLRSFRSLSIYNNPVLDTVANLQTARQIIIAKVADLTFLNKTQILPKERKGAELDYRKMFGPAWLEAGGHADPAANRPNEGFLANHPRYQHLLEKYGAPEDGEFKPQQPCALKNQLLTLDIRCPEKPGGKTLQKRLPGSMTVQKVKGLLCRLLKVPGSELRLSYETTKMEGMEIALDNDLKPLDFYSVESGDCILVRW